MVFNKTQTHIAQYHSIKLDILFLKEKTKQNKTKKKKGKTNK